MNDLVSIITPSFNTAKYIRQTIESVLLQTYKNWEMIIIDDCSTDNTDDVVRPYLIDERIRYLKNPVNSGAALSRNYALREAKGRWIAFLDSDDLWTKDKLQKQIDFMKKNNYHFSYTPYEVIDADGNPLGVYVTGPKKITKNCMYAYCWPGCLTVMYDAKYVGIIQIEDIKKNNDYAMWLKICKKENCYLFNEISAFYRKGRKGSISTQKYIFLLKWHYILFKYNENFGIVKSCFLVCFNIIFKLYKSAFYTKTL